MKDLLSKIERNNRWLIFSVGLAFFILYVVWLYFRPQESWCDDAFFADWARQLAEHNGYRKIIHGSWPPVNCPLYAYLMAIWYKVVGFSFFTAQFPNIFMTLITYWLLMVILVGRKHIESWQSIVGFSLLFWLAPTMFWTYNCGRIEVLCLLLGFLTAYYFIRAVETGTLKYKIGVFIFSILLLATGVEGVVFATLFILIYSAYNYSEAWRNNVLYIWHFGGYVVSLGILMIIAWAKHCLTLFLGFTFGFSKTITPLIVKIYSWMNYIISGEMEDVKIPSPAQSKVSFFQSIIDGITLNKEYLALTVLMVILFICLMKKISWKNIQKPILEVVTMSIVSPLVYVLAGRYALYYTWAAYIPCVIAVVMLTEQLKQRWMHVGVGLLMVIWFGLENSSMLTYHIRHAHERDKKNIKDIEKAQINPDELTCIPSSWYYYVIEYNENIWLTETSAHFPEDMSVIICNKSKPLDEKLIESYELQERCQIGDKIVYDVISKKE